MPLKPCKKCHAQVSTLARKCPHCSKRNPTTNMFKFFAVIVFIFIAANLVMVKRNADGHILYDYIQDVRGGMSFSDARANYDANDFEKEWRDLAFSCAHTLEGSDDNIERSPGTNNSWLGIVDAENEIVNVGFKYVLTNAFGVRSKHIAICKYSARSPNPDKFELMIIAQK